MKEALMLQEASSSERDFLTTLIKRMNNVIRGERSINAFFVRTLKDETLFNLNEKRIK